MRFSLKFTVGLFLFGFLPSVHAEVGRQIKIGVLTDLSGKGAYYGHQARAAAEMAKQEFDKQHIKVEIVYGDNKLDPTTAATEAQKIVSSDNVDTVFSTFSGPSRAAVTPVKNAGKLFLYAAAALEPLKTYDKAFKTYLDYVAGCKQIAARWKAEGVKEIGMLKAESEFGELCERGAKEIYPNFMTVSYAIGGDVATQVLKLKAAGLTHILDVGYEGDMRNLLKATKQINFQPRFGSNSDMYTPALINDYKDALSGSLVFGIPTPSAQFKERIHNIDPVNLTGEVTDAAMYYLSIKQLVLAVNACPAGNVTCQAEKLASLPADKEFGFVGWNKDRQADYNWEISQFGVDGFRAVGE